MPPPYRGPNTIPASADAPMIPTARARRAPGSAWVASAMPTGMVAPPPRAWTVLAATSQGRLGERAAAAEPTAKTIRAALNRSACP